MQQESPTPVQEPGADVPSLAKESKKNVVRRLYDWVLSWASTPYGTPALFCLSFAESSFFPIPPDVLQIALSAGKPRRAFWYATVSLVGSVLGAVLGYFIGLWFWEATKDFFFSYIISKENFALVAGDAHAGIEPVVREGLYHQHGFWAVFTAAVTPIPYKIFTIAAGVCHLSLALLLIASVAGRGMRFFAVAALMFFFGKKIESWIDKYFNLCAILFTVLLIGGFVLIKFVVKSH